ncbi:MAG TPA: orotate phosphoribosyltransferase [Myxococcota bacterium]|nr:orotate phosphoribosyltransferase [Myxococcota bacterium]
MDPKRLELAKLLVQRSYIAGDFVLSSGKRSSYYFDCRLTTCFAEAMPLIGEAFLAEFRRAGTNPASVGGLTMGADPIASAIAYCSLAHGRRVQAFTVRKEKKQHGTGKWIEGCAESPVAILEDTITSGGSALKAIERVKEEGLRIVQVVALVDREEGGLANIQAAVPGVPVSAVFGRGELERMREEAERPRGIS